MANKTGYIGVLNTRLSHIFTLTCAIAKGEAPLCFITMARDKILVLCGGGDSKPNRQQRSRTLTLLGFVRVIPWGQTQANNNTVTGWWLAVRSTDGVQSRRVRQTELG